ncbi:porphobilinogen deaminase protein [Penicillium macrosclerotiorum]|uniref:porphobilinogen deaminase protein n=1 Tax=Penicillium macrosclerotiorum TaxID=303699 RepID=UPI0025473478|nr:porphobilinogen deaminase protein [Penicillium macrosclerotiorum]KAJ5692641.1 porphobilinogen deaminase protein [Penicillium macrosclerotiorum]
MAADASARSLEWRAQNYMEDLPDDIGLFRDLLEKYSNIKPEKVDAHLYSIRDKGWAIHRYPCIGRWSFTNIKGLDHPSFQAIVNRLKQPGSQEAFLDVACCFGQVLRKLAFDGVDPARLYGTDLSPEFLDLGFELFNDREKFEPDSFVAADLLDPSDEGSKKLDGKITLISAGNFFHLFDRDQQLLAAKRMVKFLKPGVTDAVILGGHIGSLKPGNSTAVTGGTRFLHDPVTFQELWDEVGRTTGTEWKVSSTWASKVTINITGFPSESRYLVYIARQIDRAASS